VKLADAPARVAFVLCEKFTIIGDCTGTHESTRGCNSDRVRRGSAVLATSLINGRRQK
jgi:hypothetical protein